MSDEGSATLFKVNVRRVPSVIFPREFCPGEMRTLVVLLCGWQVFWYQGPILWGQIKEKHKNIALSSKRADDVSPHKAAGLPIIPVLR